MKQFCSDRVSHKAGLALMLTVTALASHQANAQSQSQSQLAGVWHIEKPVTALRTLEGKEPPLKAEAAKRYRDHLAARKQGDTSFDSATWCAAVGVPRIMFINYPFEIMVRPQYVGFLHEWNWWARIVYLQGALSDAPAGAMGAPPGAGPPPGGAPPGSGPPAGGQGRGGQAGIMAAKNASGPTGLSQGRWDGDTLVVETTQLDDSKLLDNAGLPHSSQLKVTERLRLTSPDVLENRVRLEDPATFTQPWETMVSYRRQRDAIIQEDVCLDRIRSGAPAVKE
jgi:hypothetical protein